MRNRRQNTRCTQPARDPFALCAQGKAPAGTAAPVSRSALRYFSAKRASLVYVDPFGESWL